MPPRLGGHSSGVPETLPVPKMSFPRKEVKHSHYTHDAASRFSLSLSRSPHNDCILAAGSLHL